MKRYIVFLGVAVLSLVLASGASAASSNAANKVHVSGSNVAIFGPTTVTVLSTSLKTSDKADLLIEFNSECEVSFSDSDNRGADFFGSFGDFDFMAVSAVVWVTIDGVPVPVDPATGDDGRVVYCKLTQTESKNIFAGGDTVGAQENLSQTTISANSFRWFAFDVGSGTHLVEVKATLVETAVSIEGAVNGVLGRRTLVVIPMNNLN